MKYFLIAVLIGWTTQITAQSEAYLNSPLFAQVGLGIFPTFAPANVEISAAVGYRFNQYLGLGAEYRLTNTSNVSFSRSANVLGLHLRGQLKPGWIISLGGGTVLSATEGDDGFFAYEYRSGGHYFAVDLGYPFRWGLTVGLYTTAVQDQRYNVLEWNGTNTYEPTGETSTDRFVSFGLKVGYAFPRRGNDR